MPPPSRETAGRGFALREVVAAVAVAGVALLAALGLFTLTARTAGEVEDRMALARLAEAVRGELARLQGERGWADFAAGIPASEAGAPLMLVATRAGDAARRADGAQPAADRALDDPALPGIAARDRYFLVELRAAPGYPPDPDAGFLVLAGRVAWPYRLPLGPATDGATRWDADPARETSPAERRSEVLLFAVRP